MRAGFALVPAGADAFDNAARLRNVLANSNTQNLPIYLIHKKEDDVVPLSHGEGLYRLMVERRSSDFPPFWA